MMRRIRTLLFAGLVLASPIAMGAVSDEEFAQLRADLAALSQRFEALAAENAELKRDNQQTAQVAEQAQQDVAAVRESTGGESWADRIKLQGDFRYRYQNDEISQNLATALGDKDSRNRQRIRARAAIVAKMKNDFEVGFGMATGGDDPVSTNQTLGGGGSTKDVRLDLAYADWSGLANTHIRGGKFKNTFETVSKSQLQWDGDWRPEGLDAKWDNGTFFAQGLGTWLESDSNSAGTEFSYFLQGGARAELAGIKLTGGIGYTAIDAAGKPCFYEEDDFSYCGGNQIDASGNYLYDFEVYDIFAQAAFKLIGVPLEVFGDFVKNDAANEFDTGYLVGAKLGSAKKAGTWDIKYYYEDLESNATLGLLTNSDFGGGGTNGEGSVFSGTYAVTDDTNIKLTYYLVERNSDAITDILGGQQADVDTLQLDFNFKYK
jgi:hypothetical protein